MSRLPLVFGCYTAMPTITPKNGRGTETEATINL